MKYVKINVSAYKLYNISMQYYLEITKIYRLNEHKYFK